MFVSHSVYIKTVSHNHNMKAMNQLEAKAKKRNKILNELLDKLRKPQNVEKRKYIDI